MIVKRYSPVRIQDPTSHQHIVRVKPGQRINLSLSNKLYPNLDVAVLSEYLKIESCEVDDHRRVYTLSHNSDVHEWSEYSQFFLGEIWIDYDRSIAKLGVLMESVNDNKKKFVTLVNPDSSDLRVKPHNVLEVVLFDESFGRQDEWHCEWHPKIPTLGLEQIGSDHLCLQSWNHWGVIDDDPSYPYAKLPRINPPINNWMRQHHFWFRFGSHFESLNQLVQDYRGEIAFAGQLCFEGHSDSKRTKNSVDLYLDCRKPKASLFAETACMKTKDECSPFAFSSVDNKKKKHKQKQNFPSYPVVKHVDVVVADQSFASCRIAESFREESKQEFEDDAYGFDRDFHPFPHRSGFPITRYV